MGIGMIDGLYAGNQTTTQADYIRVLNLPQEATWGDICKAQNDRYRATGQHILPDT